MANQSQSIDGISVNSIKQDPTFQALVKKRNRLSLILTGIMLVTYFGFIGLIAFDKAFLAKQLGGSVVTIGIPLGFSLILLSIILTWIFVRRANGEFDDMRDKMLAKIGKDKDA